MGTGTMMTLFEDFESVYTLVDITFGNLLNLVLVSHSG